MCGISGAYGPNSKVTINRMVNALKHRGPDGFNIEHIGNLSIGHNLLSIVGNQKQPITDNKYYLIANCEIYNWKELASKYRIDCDSDSKLLFELLKRNQSPSYIKKLLREIDGMYAFGFFWEENGVKGILTRDFFGEKPLWYYNDKKNFYFASEKKALPLRVHSKAFDLNPRHILFIDFDNMKIKDVYKGYYKYSVLDEGYNKAITKTRKLIINSVKTRVDSTKRVGILVSGGVDSSLIATISSKFNKNIVCYNVATKEGQDREYAKILQRYSNLNIKYITPSKSQVQKAIPKIIKIIESSDPVKLSVALPYYFAAKEAKKDGVKIMLSGNGADDVFCGYERYDQNYSPSKDTISKLRKIYDTDIYRDDLIFMNFGIELRLPYLSKKLVDYVIKLPDRFKIEDNIRKKILRDVAKEFLPQEIYSRPKKAAQYGSKMDKIFENIVKHSDKNNRGAYLKQYRDTNESSIASLFSGGKDSVLSLHIMHNMNYKISCLITIDSENKDSYMYHTPTINLTSLQADALQIPIIVAKTLGHKELELRDLSKALIKAKNKYHINGVVTGAIYSTYQRDRVENVCDKIGLKVFSPLWHMDQYLEVKEIIDKGIKPIITKIAAYGLDKNFIGKEIDMQMLEHLKSLNDKIGFNIAGEGGEYESLVLDAPMFNKKLQIMNYQVISLGQSSYEIKVDDAKLVDK